MRFGSLFSGIGGFDLGFEQAGLSCAWQVEIDKDCQKVLEARLPNVTRFTDVKDVGQFPTVDVICGGFPCQDLSVAGKRKGLAGERSGLWFEFLRIVGLNRPRWIVIENVPGLLSSDEGRDFAVILRGLVECGYCLAWRIVDAQFYGVAQRRRRVFIVGSLGDGSCAEILFESESVSWNPPTRREAGQRVTPILEAGARTNGDGQRDGDGIGVEGDPMFTLQSGHQHGVAAPVTSSFAKHHGASAGKDSYPHNLIAMPLKAKANSSHDESHETYVYHENIDGKVYGSEQCPALRNFQKDAPMVAATLDQRGRGPTDAVMMNLQIGHRMTAFGEYEDDETASSLKQRDFKDATDLVVTHALSSEGADASEDGTSRGTGELDQSQVKENRGVRTYGVRRLTPL